MKPRATAAAAFVLASLASPAAAEDPPAEPLRFSNGGVELHGELLLPAGDGPHPAMVFLHGSGCGTRADLRAFARHFAARGIAGLLFDKRGCGESGGRWQQSSLEELAGDAEAALALLAAHPAIDRSRIGLWGISQSGWIAPIAANRSGLARFLVVVTGGGATPREVERYGYAGRLAHAGFRLAELPAASALLDGYFRYLASGEGHAELLRAMDAASREPWFGPLGLKGVVPGREHQPAWSWVANYDPLGDIGRLRVPSLVLLGAQDGMAPLAESVRGWSGGLARFGVALSMLVVFPQAGHGLTVGSSHGPPGTPRQYVEGFLPTVENWLDRVLQPD